MGPTHLERRFVGCGLTRAEIFKIVLGLRGPSMRKGRTLPCPQARRMGPGQEMGGQKTMLKKTLITFAIPLLVLLGSYAVQSARGGNRGGERSTPNAQRTTHNV